MKIFVSHADEDAALVDALDELHEKFWDPCPDLVRSSNQAAGRGIPLGGKWLSWINEQIGGATKTYVVLTPNSVRSAWVLWESGVAAGVALAKGSERPVVPITFGIPDDAVPSPFRSTQIIRGDIEGPNGIVRLLQSLNEEPGLGLAASAFSATVEMHLGAYLSKVGAHLSKTAELDEEVEPGTRILSAIPHNFPAERLTGLWVTSYRFTSGGQFRYHADIAEVNAESERRLTASNCGTIPVTEAHKKPFCNSIDAEVASRHVIGHWKNTSDERYFGTIHLAVLTGEDVMDGWYTALATDIEVGRDHWRWVRIDPGTYDGVDLSKMQMRAAADVYDRLVGHSHRDGPIGLDEVVGKI